MEKPNIIAYELSDSLYLNITNRCSNRCVFCIRETNGGVGYDLWVSHEPSAAEVISAIPDPGRYREIVFCGYGEPLMRPEVVMEVARYLKQWDTPVRLNTNGLADLFLERDVLPELKGLIDVVSISLNASDAASYQQISQSRFGEPAFPAVIEFARRCQHFIPRVILSVVRVPGVDVEKARDIAEAMGLEFRVREFQGG